MSLVTSLGCGDTDASVMRQVRRLWPVWVAREPALGVVGDPADLPEWTADADPAAADEVLRTLAQLGSPTGGQEQLATSVLAWVLVPGAVTVARRLADLSPDIDKLVASHLWISCLEHDWTRSRFTAVSILRETRRAVCAELEVGREAQRRDKAWSNAVRVDPTSPTWELVVVDTPASVPAVELLDLLEDATADGLIDAADGELLIELAVVVDEQDPHRVTSTKRRDRSGLFTRRAVEVVGTRHGVSGRTVSRRAARCLDVLTTNYASAEPTRSSRAGRARRPGR